MKVIKFKIKTTIKKAKIDIVHELIWNEWDISYMLGCLDLFGQWLILTQKSFFKVRLLYIDERKSILLKRERDNWEINDVYINYNNN